MALPITSAPLGHHRHEVTHHHDPKAAAWELEQMKVERKLERKDVRERRTHFYAVGRIFLSTLFIVSATVKAVRFDAVEELLVAIGFVDVGLLLPIAIAVEFFGGLALALGYKARAAAVTLLSYLAVVTVVVHYDFSLIQNRALVLTNLALGGALFMALAHGGGAFSLDSWLQRRRAKLLDAIE
jgi:putative oxidoreductase